MESHSHLFSHQVRIQLLTKTAKDLFHINRSWKKNGSN